MQSVARYCLATLGPPPLMTPLPQEHRSFFFFPRVEGYNERKQRGPDLQMNMDSTGY